MYYEVLKVREYQNKGSKYYQIRLLKDSNFKEVSEIALINVSEIKELEKKIKELENNETSKQYKELETKHYDLIKAYDNLKKENTKLKIESDKLKETIIKNTPKLENNYKEIQDLNNKIKDTYEKLSNEKDFNKACLITINDLNNRNFFNRLINKKPESYNLIMKLKEIPEDITNNKK